MLILLYIRNTMLCLRKWGNKDIEVIKSEGIFLKWGNKYIEVKNERINKSEGIYTLKL